MSKNIIMTLPKWFDLHTHLRQDELLPFTIRDHLAGACAGVLAMPNTKPPIAKVFSNDALPYQSIESYCQQIKNQGGAAFERIIIPLYLCKDSNAAMITAGAKQGLLKAAKYYPPHGTTGAEFACDIEHLSKNGTFAAMEEHGVILCIHGEEHNLSSEDYFDKSHNAETLFYQNTLPNIRQKFPKLKIVCEHITTAAAVRFVKQQTQYTAATITPQHLIYTVGHLLQGLKYHLYCLPLLKYEQDRQALRDAVIQTNNQQFFAGTDSAPHTHKATKCGCAAGCYTAGIGAQLYAEAFELSGLDLSRPQAQQIFRQFLCENGPAFYNIPLSKQTFTLSRYIQKVTKTVTPAGTLTPLIVGLSDADEAEINWSIKQ